MYEGGFRWYLVGETDTKSDKMNSGVRCRKKTTELSEGFSLLLELQEINRGRSFFLRWISIWWSAGRSEEKKKKEKPMDERKDWIMDEMLFEWASVRVGTA